MNGDELGQLRAKKSQQAIDDMRNLLMQQAEKEEELNAILDTWPVAAIYALAVSIDRASGGSYSPIARIEDYEAEGSPNGDTFGDLIAWAKEQDDYDDSENTEGEE